MGNCCENIDMYKILYDSIQIMVDNEELNRLMDKHQLEEHKRTLSEHAQTLFVSLVSIFLSLTIICIFCFMWNDRNAEEALYCFAARVNSEACRYYVAKGGKNF